MGAEFWIGFVFGALAASTAIGVAAHWLDPRSRRYDHDQQEALRRAAWREARRL